ncbi:SymE family type I addiction module toxin [Sphingobacterium bambusae]|uniref:SymE family type I addiction module toxin n=1 Tax=Sphingobacterium bambusae TaxID=662858 RepID=A0ABW6BAN3_9SPHI
MEKRLTKRYIKVYKRAVERGGNSYIYRYYVWCPEIRLQGKWLQECGFQAGQRIQVSMEANKLIISICPDNVDCKRSRK